MVSWGLGAWGVGKLEFPMSLGKWSDVRSRRWAAVPKHDSPPVPVPVVPAGDGHLPILSATLLVEISFADDVEN